MIPKELGGLVYAASGHWIINNYAIDLSGTKINAGAAQTLGVLVCRGCKVDDKTTYGVESYLGLYLEDRAYWDTAYRGAHRRGAIVASGVTSFDEWVGSGVKPNNGSKLMDADWNTVVSLHTQKNKLDMDGDSTKDNSYHNRSSFGRSQNTNGNTRYFYNLDIALRIVKAALVAVKSIQRTSCSYGLLSAMLPPVFVRQSFPMVRQGSMIP